MCARLVVDNLISLLCVCTDFENCPSSPDKTCNKKWLPNEHEIFTFYFLIFDICNVVNKADFLKKHTHKNIHFK